MFLMCLILTSKENNYVLGRLTSPVFHSSRGRPFIVRRQPLGILGDRWSSLTCEGAAKLQPLMTGIDLSVQRT